MQREPIRRPTSYDRLTDRAEEAVRGSASPKAVGLKEDLHQKSLLIPHRYTNEHLCKHFEYYSNLP